MGEILPTSRTPAPRREPERYSLNWKQTVNTVTLSRWEAGDYRLDGRGREYGGGIRREWVLTFRGTIIGQPSRLAEGKRDADRHRGISRPDVPRSLASVDDAEPQPDSLRMVVTPSGAQKIAAAAARNRASAAETAAPVEDEQVYGPPVELGWTVIADTVYVRRLTAGDYRLDELRNPTGATPPTWTLYHRVTAPGGDQRWGAIGRPDSEENGKREAQLHAEAAAEAAEQQTPRPRARCTHGGDCAVHPKVHGIHDFTPRAEDVLRALEQWAIEHEQYETRNEIGRLAAEIGVTL